MTWQAEMSISDLSLPEPVAHELFPNTFFSLSDLELTKHLRLFQEQPSRQCQKQYITTTANVIDMSSEKPYSNHKLRNGHPDPPEVILNTGM